jgi:hypothetical protein
LPDSAHDETRHRRGAPAYQRRRQSFGRGRTPDLCAHDSTEGTYRAANDRAQSATLDQ